MVITKTSAEVTKFGAPEDIADQPAWPVDKEGRIARETGLSVKEVKERLHKVRENLPRKTDVRNPVVAVDVVTGEIHPKNLDGTYGIQSGTFMTNKSDLDVE